MDEQKPKSMIEIIKEAGYVMVVRCKDCKHSEKVNNIYVCNKNRWQVITREPDWFCADGERKPD